MNIRELPDYVVSEFFGDDDKQNAIRDISLSLLGNYPYHNPTLPIQFPRHPFTRNTLSISYLDFGAIASVGDVIRAAMRYLGRANVIPTNLVLWQFHFRDDELVSYTPESDTVCDIYADITFNQYDVILAGGSALNDYTMDGMYGYNGISRFFAFLSEAYHLPVHYHDVDTQESGPMLARLRKYKEQAHAALCRR